MIFCMTPVLQKKITWRLIYWLQDINLSFCNWGNKEKWTKKKKTHTIIHTNTTKYYQMKKLRWNTTQFSKTLHFYEWILVFGQYISEQIWLQCPPSGGHCDTWDTFSCSSRYSSNTWMKANFLSAHIQTSDNYSFTAV